MAFVIRIHDGRLVFAHSDAKPSEHTGLVTIYAWSETRLRWGVREYVSADELTEASDSDPRLHQLIVQKYRRQSRDSSSRATMRE